MQSYGRPGTADFSQNKGGKDNFQMSQSSFMTPADASGKGGFARFSGKTGPASEYGGGKLSSNMGGGKLGPETYGGKPVAMNPGAYAKGAGGGAPGVPGSQGGSFKGGLPNMAAGKGPMGSGTFDGQTNMNRMMPGAYASQGGYGAPQGGRPMQQQAMQHQAYNMRPGMWAGQGQGMQAAAGKGMSGMQAPGNAGGQYGGPYGGQMQMGGPGSAVRGPTTQRGPPRREMDSLLEEIKAKQRLQEQKKEILMKVAEERAGGVETAMPTVQSINSRFPPPSDLRTALGMPQVTARSERGRQVQVLWGEAWCAARVIARNQDGTVRVVYDEDGSFEDVEEKRVKAGPAPPVAPQNSGVPGRATPKPDGDLPEKAPAAAAGPEVLRTLYLRELPHSINEDVLCQLFSRYGMVTAVSILYAQDRKEVTSGYLTMDTRENASRAKDALHDRDVDDVPLWIEWAKGPPPQASEDGMVDGVPAKAWRTTRYPANDNGGGGWRSPHYEDDSRSSSSSSRSRSRQNRRESRKTNFSTGPMSGGSAAELGGLCQLPSGSLVEAPSVVQGRGDIPEPSPAPVVPSAPRIPAGWTEADIAEERERQRLEEKATLDRQRRDRDKKGIAGGKRLTDNDWDRLEQLLRNLDGARSLILEVMVFCLDKSDWAIEITECITESLTIPETEMSVKLARLLVVSDVLHNTCSSKPAAWAYRREFERNLPDILEHLHWSLMRVESKIQLEKFKEQILKILLVWEDWGLFAPQYTRGLEAALVVGVKSLRFLRSKGDTSREPAWMELKLTEWRRQHFSQLEKMCRTRGLRSSTSHLEPTKDLTLEEARRDWLIDRLACYELHWHDKEQAPVSKQSRSKQISAEDIDGEAIECDIDGFPLEEGDLDGERIDVGDIDRLEEIIEATRVLPENNLGRCQMLIHARGEPLIEPVAQDPHLQASASREATATTSHSAPAPTDDRFDIQKLEDPRRLDPLDADVAGKRPDESRPSGVNGEEEGNKAIDRTVLRGIELEVIELRASLEAQGLFRDAIQDICDEKRQSLIREHEAILASPMNKDSDETIKPPQFRNIEDDSDSDSSDLSAKERHLGLEKEKEREKERERELEILKLEKLRKEEEKKREQERFERDRFEREREKEKAKKDKSKDKAKPRGKDIDDKGHDMSESPIRRNRERDKKDRTNKKRASRSRSREQVKKKVRR